MNIVGVGAIFIDDIVLSDGRTHMGVLGGGTVHAMMGAAIWDERPGLCAFAGEDLPESVEIHLNAAMDIQGVIRLDFPQIRAWQIFEDDGTRHEIHRVKEIAPFIAGTQPKHLHPTYKKSKAFYLLQHFDGVCTWINEDTRNSIILWEPNALSMSADNRDAMREVLQNYPEIDVVSPNLDEAKAVYGINSPEACIDAMFDDGAKAVALRMGAEGSIVADRETGEQHHIGVVRVPEIVDQTGAGNAYCGGMLAGMVQGKSLQESAMMGVVSASFCLESVGVIGFDTVTIEERDRRFEQLK